MNSTYNIDTYDLTCIENTYLENIIQTNNYDNEEQQNIHVIYDVILFKINHICDKYTSKFFRDNIYTYILITLLKKVVKNDKHLCNFARLDCEIFSKNFLEQLIEYFIEKHIHQLNLNMKLLHNLSKYSLKYLELLININKDHEDILNKKFINILFMSTCSESHENNNNIDLIKLLLNYGANINSTNSILDTPILINFKLHKYSTFKLLLDYKPDLSIINAKYENIIILFIDTFIFYYDLQEHNKLLNSNKQIANIIEWRNELFEMFLLLIEYYKNNKSTNNSIDYAIRYYVVHNKQILDKEVKNILYSIDIDSNVKSASKLESKT